MSSISTRAGHRAQQAGKTSLWLIVPYFGMGGPHPHTVSQAAAPFFHLAPARPASSDALRERFSDSCCDRAQLALRAVSMGPESDFSGRCDRDCDANALRSN
jgi:hypothetical protein